MSIHEGQMGKGKVPQHPASRQQAPMIGQGTTADDLREAHNMGGVGQGSLTTKGDTDPHNMSRHQVNVANTKEEKNPGHRE